MVAGFRLCHEVINGILQGWRRDDFNHLSAQGRRGIGKLPGQRPVAAADAPTRAKHQHPVAHSVKDAFKLGCLLSRCADVLLNIFGHAVHGVRQGRELAPWNAAQATLKVAQRYGLHH